MQIEYLYKYFIPNRTYIGIAIKYLTSHWNFLDLYRFHGLYAFPILFLMKFHKEIFLSNPITNPLNIKF